MGYRPADGRRAAAHGGGGRAHAGDVAAAWRAAGVAAVLAAAAGHCAWFYLLLVSYPALAIGKIRSFYEHRAERDAAARSVLNEAAWPWRLLFLNLNYHLVHHDLPGLPWYGLRKVYLAERDAYRRRSQGFVVPGYGSWFKQHAVTPLDVGVHPFLAGAGGKGNQNAAGATAAILSARWKRVLYPK
nr:fatty acid desaturase [Serratia sp. JUb9]